MTIADRIRNRRLELGLSVDDLAKLLNKNRATVYRYESNFIKSYSADVMESLAKALDTTPAYFYGYDDDHVPELPSAKSPISSSEAIIISGGVDNMPPEKRKQALQIMQVAFPEYSDLFTEPDKG